MILKNIFLYVNTIPDLDEIKELVQSTCLTDKKNNAMVLYAKAQFEKKSIKCFIIFQLFEFFLSQNFK